MYDIRWIRANAEEFDRRLRDRKGVPFTAAELIALDDARKAAILSLEELQARRNAASKEIGKAKAHKDEVARHILGSESDFGAGRVWRLRAGVKPEASAAIDQIMDVLKPLGVERAPGEGSGGSDISKMHELGMAALSLTQDGMRYFDWHHTANDTLDKVVPADLQQNVAVYAVWGLMAAEAEGDFGSKPGAFGQAKND